MKKLGLLFVFALILGLTGSAFAQTQRARKSKYNINQRQENQINRVEEGVDNGSLTPNETQHLIKQQDRIADKEDQFRESGDGLTLKERAKLAEAQNKASKNIFVQKHDKQGETPKLPSINKRQDNQINRIEEGVDNGSLTPKETQGLIKQQDRISDAEDRMRESGGGLNMKERAKLQRGLNKSSRSIYKQKHDRQGRRP